MNNEVIVLVTVIGTEKDASGFKTNEESVNTEIFADVKSVNRMEHYEALRSGINASIIFDVNPDDFELADRNVEIDGKNKRVQASKVCYEERMYRIIRTYKNRSGMLELTCSEVE